MERSPEPTRAEATDVFNAILDGTDAVMLSGETSKGLYPAQAIAMMTQIAQQAEQYFFEDGNRRTFEEVLQESRRLVPENTRRLQKELVTAYMRTEDRTLKKSRRDEFAWQAKLYAAKLERSEKQPTTDRICEAACALSEEGMAEDGKNDQETYMPIKAIIAPTTSGRTAFMISRFRPRALIIGAAHAERTHRKLLLSFGVYPVNIGSGQETVREVLEQAIRHALHDGLLTMNRGEEEFNVVATSGDPLNEPGTTNLVQVLRIEKPEKTMPMPAGTSQAAPVEPVLTE